MDATGWWMNLLQGAIGSLIGLVGLFVVFYLTRIHERKRDREMQKVDLRDRTDEHVRDAVASVIESAYSLRVYEEGHEGHARSLSHSLMMFSVRAVENYPSTGEWAQQKSIDVLDCLTPGNDPRAVIWEAAYVAGSLVHWLANGRPDSLRPKPEDRSPKKDQKDDFTEDLIGVARAELRQRGLPSTFENMSRVLNDRLAADAGFLDRLRTSDKDD